MQPKIENFIWNNIIELNDFFPQKVSQRLNKLKEINNKKDFINNLEIIFSMDITLYDSIEKHYQQLHKAIYSISDMIKLLQNDSSKESINKAEQWIDDTQQSSEMARLLDLIGNFYYEQAQYDEALKYFSKALNMNQAVLGENHANTAESYSHLGLLNISLGKYDQALPFLLKALEIREAVFGENHAHTATSYNNLASLYDAKKEYDQALSLHKKALSIREETFGKSHPDTAASYNNLALLYESLDMHDEALQLQKKALEICEKSLGENHANTAKSYNNLASLYDARGEYDQALPLYQKALGIQEAIFGENHPDTAISYNNLALLYEAKGDYDQALPLLQKALGIQEAVLGENHPDTATCYNTLASFYNSMGTLEENFKSYIQSHGINHSITKILFKDLSASKNNFFIDSTYIENPLFITSVIIKNFKLLEGFEINFTKGINIIIGENSSGKTSLLQAITLGLLRENYLGEINDYEKYITKSQTEAKITLSFDKYDDKTITLQSNKREVKNNVLSPFVLAYGSNIFTKYKLEVNDLVDDLLSANIKRDFANSIFIDYTDTFYNPKSILNELSQRSDQKAQELEKTFRTVINDFVEGFTLEKENTKYIFKCDKNNDFKLENLSEGYRNSILLIGDILIKVLGVGKTPDTIEGVILIDEFDRHLHPKWQSNLVSKLHALFPKIQFILTTHNPMSIMDRNGDEITILKEIDKKIKAMRGKGTKSIDISTILLEYFNVESTISNTMRKKINSFNKLKLQKELTSDEVQELKELEEFLGQTIASNFIYDRKYLRFLEYIKEHKNIDFDRYEEVDEEEMNKLLADFGNFFND